jgi:undecaprenyl diphosphate synthase
MDGNGRWAKSRGLARTKGHEKGVEVIRDITTHCSRHLSVQSATFYAFSTENWKRPKLEVEFLMKLLERYIKSERPTYHENNIRFKAIGDLEAFSPKLRESIAQTEEQTAHYTGLTQVLALNYGGRDEIVRAVRRLQQRGEEITEAGIDTALDTPYTNIDLLIRTSGEQRLSNYLLWQLSYAELAFTPTLWPDFTVTELDRLVSEFYSRERRYGGI